MEILTYVLHGMWNTSDMDGVEIIGVSVDLEPLLKKLDEIARTKAREYADISHFSQEDRGERYYEVADGDGGYVKFYITEHKLELSEGVMGAISWEVTKSDLTSEIREYLRDLYEGGNIEAWKYEYMVRKPEVMQEILKTFEQVEDCDMSFNGTMFTVVGNAVKRIVLNDEKMKYLWEELRNVPVDGDECILDDFLGFGYGTHREEIWRWFDGKYSGGIAKLMLGMNNQCKA